MHAIKIYMFLSIVFINNVQEIHDEHTRNNENFCVVATCVILIVYLVQQFMHKITVLKNVFVLVYLP